MSETDVVVKTEPEWEVPVIEAAELPDLYNDHKVKDEMVLGPEVVQPHDVPYAVVDVDPLIKSEIVEEDEAGDGGCSSLSLSESGVSDVGVRAEVAAHARICGERLPAQSNLTEYISLFVNPELARGTSNADVCSTKLISKSNFIKNTEQKVYECDVCQKQFKFRRYLTMHFKIHTGYKPHKCEICNKQFTIKSNLQKHMDIHTGVKPHKCEICDKQFLQKVSLQRHMKMHDEGKPYPCDICYRQYKSEPRLNRHVKRIHDQPKRSHVCEICSKQFVSQSKLKRHVKIHT